MPPSFEDKSGGHRHVAERSRGGQPALVMGEGGMVAEAPVLCLQGGFFLVLTAALGKAVPRLIPLEKEGEGARLAPITNKRVCEL